MSPGPRCAASGRRSGLLFSPAPLLLAVCIASLGCGGSSSTGSSSSLTFIVQPDSATTPLGQTATFTAEASGTGALAYQWSVNGTAIPGATAASWTTPAVTLSDNGATVTVTVSGGRSSITSAPAILTVGPRSPASGDLRFQQVDSAATAFVSSYGSDLNFFYPRWYKYPGTLGGPLRLGLGECVTGVAQDCRWEYTNWALPAGNPLTVFYFPDTLDELDGDLSPNGSPFADLGGNTAQNIVVTSMDIESSEDVFAMSLVQGASGGFDLNHETASLSSLPADVAADAANGRVVTAVSLNDASGNVDFLSYGWSQDTKTAYDTDVETASYDNIGTTATALANEGYILTAFGGNGTDGYILIGTKVQGDTLPRPLLVSPAASVSMHGYALVGWAVNDGYQSNGSPPVWLFQK